MSNHKVTKRTLWLLVLSLSRLIKSPPLFFVRLRALNRTAVSPFESKANCAFGSNGSNILSV
ncbi:hypothetical protein J9303_12505 [Bacillaceae bacterium Marseille-Q3522]|nr:hypothetical protein [Bacillaceae bacterium Marseille-Q3522]